MWVCQNLCTSPKNIMLCIVTNDDGASRTVCLGTQICCSDAGRRLCPLIIYSAWLKHCSQFYEAIHNLRSIYSLLFHTDWPADWFRMAAPHPIIKWLMGSFHNDQHLVALLGAGSHNRQSEHNCSQKTQTGIHLPLIKFYHLYLKICAILLCCSWIPRLQRCSVSLHTPF